MIWTLLISALSYGAHSPFKELTECSKQVQCQSELTMIIDRYTIRCPNFENLMNLNVEKETQDTKQECVKLASKIHVDNIEFLIRNDAHRISTDFFLFILLQDRKLADELMAVIIENISQRSLKLYFVSLIDKLSTQKKLKTMLALLKIVKEDIGTLDPERRIAKILTRDCISLNREPISAIGVKLLEQTLVTSISQEHRCAQFEMKILDEIFFLDEEDVYINLFLTHLDFKIGSTAYIALMKTNLKYLCNIYGSSEMLYFNMKKRDVNWITHCYQLTQLRSLGDVNYFAILSNLLEFNQKYNNPIELDINLYNSDSYKQVIESHNEAGLFSILEEDPGKALAIAIKKENQEKTYWLSKMMMGSFSKWKQIELSKAFRLKDRFAVYLINTKGESFHSSNFDKTVYDMAVVTKHKSAVLKYSLLLESKSSEHTCSVCLNEIENPFDLEYTKCEHLFHASCLNKWTTPSCPLCRYENYRESLY